MVHEFHWCMNFTSAWKGDSEKLDNTSRKQGNPPLVITTHLVLLFFFKFFKTNFIYLFEAANKLFICFWVLVASCDIFGCGMWDQVPWPRVEPGPPALGAQTLRPLDHRGTPHPIFQSMGKGFQSCATSEESLHVSWDLGSTLPNRN